MLERARIAAQTCDVQNFKASNGCIENFLRRTEVQNSVRLHGRGNSDLPANHSERMAEIRSIAQGYSIRNIYNMDESGLFYRMCPRISYLSPDEKMKRSMRYRVTTSQISLDHWAVCE